MLNNACMFTEGTLVHAIVARMDATGFDPSDPAWRVFTEDEVEAFMVDRAEREGTFHTWGDEQYARVDRLTQRILRAIPARAA